MSCLAATNSLGNLTPNLQAFAEVLGSGGYVFEIIQRKSKINIFNDDGKIPSNFTGDIEFKNVHFTYPSRPEAPVRYELSCFD
jgi:ATP-binding cassette subfamily B (MDR/TAP) protein 1